MNNNPGNTPLRVGILGYSDIARRKFIPALLQSGNSVLSGIASRNPANVSATDSVAGPPVMGYQELIESPDVDLVYISLPNSLHEEWVVKALKRCKHVLCEKPLGLSLQSVIRMLEAAGENNKLLYENLMYLQHPQHGIVKSLVADGHIGKVCSMRSEFTFPGPDEGDFRLDPAMGGGAFNDMNRYPLSAALFFLEGTSHRFIQGSTTVRDGLTRSLQAETITDAGERFSFLTAFDQSYRSFYEINGERGSIRVERAYTTPADMKCSIAVTIDGRDESFTVPESDHFLSTIEHVCELIQRGTWSEEHRRSRKLAELADMFLDACVVKEHGNEIE